tara:strand:+ start:107 stop:622 length:516 start_codon:yes stop_codon:yes gene_type:complete
LDNIRLSKVLIKLNISLNSAINYLKKHKNIKISKNPNILVSKDICILLSEEFVSGKSNFYKASTKSSSSMNLEFEAELIEYKKQVVGCLSKYLSQNDKKVIRNKKNINSLKHFLSRGISYELREKLNEENINYFIPPKKRKRKSKKKKKNSSKNTKPEPFKIIYTPMGNKR